MPVGAALVVRIFKCQRLFNVNSGAPAIVQNTDHAISQFYRHTFRLAPRSLLTQHALLLLACAIVWIGRQGMFRGMGYTVRRIFVALHSQEYRDAHKETYSEYCERKGLRKTPCLFLLITGCAYLVPAVTFAVLYFTV